MKEHRNNVWVPQLIATIALLWAFNSENPYGYYVFLRVICCSVFAYLTVQAFRKSNERWTWVLGVTAFIYNPIFQIHLTRDIWFFINIVTIGIAVASIFCVRKNG